DRELRRGERHRGTNEVVHRVAVPRDERCIRMRDAAGMVRLQDGGGVRQAGAHRFWSPAESGEEMRLDEPGDDAYLRLDIVPQQTDRNAVDLPHGDVVIVARAVV